MSLLVMLLPLAYLVFGAWLMLRVLRLFLGPLYAAQSPQAPVQLFVTDYYVLLGQIAFYSLLFDLGTSRYKEGSLVFLPLFIGVLALIWFVATRMLSKARVRRFLPRAAGQIALPLELVCALYVGFTAVPAVISLLGSAFFLIVLVIFVFSWLVFHQLSKWIVSRADPLPEELDAALKIEPLVSSPSTDTAPNPPPPSDVPPST